MCLRTKKLAPPDTLIYDFLKMAMEPPTQLSVQSAVRYLISIGALDELENLTDLGEHLLQLSVDPKLGKMLIYAVAFKCVDPVLTMVAVLSHK